MKYYRQILLVVFVFIAISLGFIVFSPKEEKNIEKTVTETKAKVENIEPKEKQAPVVVAKEKKTIIKKGHLYGDYPSDIITFSAISQAVNSTDKVKSIVRNYVESSEAILYSVQNSGKLYLIKEVSFDESEKFPRHGIEFVEISLSDGNVEKFYTGNYDDSESEQDVWEYDKKNASPISHTHKDSDGNIVFTELWNVSEDIKYKMVDADDNVISMYKESVDDNTKLRQEHIFYDSEGKIRMNISASYDGMDLVRFTYYDAQNPQLSGNIVSDFEDGIKQKETVYTSDYKVKNVYKAEYSEGDRVEIKVYDNSNQELEKILSE